MTGRADLQVIQGVPPVTFTAYSVTGAMLCRVTAVKPPFSFSIPKEYRKRVARTETMDSRGEIIAKWTAPDDWPCWKGAKQ